MMIDFKYYNHLGFHNPYYTIKNNSLIIDSDINSILIRQETRTLDFTAVVQILSTGYVFGDRTLIKEIKKTPWMAKPNPDFTGWDFFTVPKHQEINISEEESAAQLFQLLNEELYEYVKNHTHIGFLLTGGMDSRIVAAVLQNLIKKDQLVNKKITAYTWGSEESRDVVYAKRISELYGWNWRHVAVDAEQMRKNCELTIQNGCEFTPIHLHAMSKVANESDLDCVLAGSFGDSIGRGEYSSIKVKDLKPLKAKIKNPGGLLRDDYLKIAEKEINDDLASYHQKFPEEKEYQQHELDMQLHYMRRMLNACMSIIDKKTPLYQMFSSPKVFGYIWAINPIYRTDMLYKVILEKNAPELMEIPWARTGLKYPETLGIADQFKKSHHDYGKMIRNNFLGEIEAVVQDNIEICKKIFNYNNVKQLIRHCRKFPIENSYSSEEKLLWIAVLLEFIQNNKIEIDLPDSKRTTFINYYKNIILYKIKFYYKKLK